MIIKKENKEEKTQSLRRKLSCSKIQQFIAEAFNILWYKSGKHIFFFKKRANFSLFSCEEYAHWVRKVGYLFSNWWRVLCSISKSSLSEEILLACSVQLGLTSWFRNRFFFGFAIFQELYLLTYLWGQKCSRLKEVLQEKMKGQSVLKRVPIPIPPCSWISGNSWFY